MSEFPAADLPADFPSDLELRMQNHKIFDELHRVGEQQNFLYSTAHTAIALAGGRFLESPSLAAAMDTGVKVYEVASGIANPPDRYADEDEKPVVLANTTEFVQSIRGPESFARGAAYAYQRMRQDAPNLTELVEQVSSRYVHHNEVDTRFALEGAALMRGIHIAVTRELATR